MQGGCNADHRNSSRLKHLISDCASTANRFNPTSGGENAGGSDTNLASDFQQRTKGILGFQVSIRNRPGQYTFVKTLRARSFCSVKTGGKDIATQNRLFIHAEHWL